VLTSKSYLRLVVAEVVDLTGALDTNLSRIEAADEELRLGRVLSASERPVAGSTAPMMVRQPFAAHWAEVTQHTRRITATSPSISDEGTACNNEGEEDG